MNRNSPPSSVAVDEPDFQSVSKQSMGGASSLDREEEKSQTNKRDQQPKPGLYISLTSAQAYSVMKNIPKKFRLIEKANVKKQLNKVRRNASNTPKKRKKREIV